MQNKKDCNNCIYIEPVKNQPACVSCTYMWSCYMNNKNRFEQNMRIQELIDKLNTIKDEYGDIQVKCSGREEPIAYPDYYSNLSINSIEVVNFYKHIEPYAVLSSDYK